MNKIVKNTLLSFCAASLIVGCATKDVAYDSQSTSQTEQTQSTSSSVDNTIESIEGSQEVAVSDDVDQESTNTIDISSPETIMSNGINEVRSDIDNQVVILKSVHFGFDKYNLTDSMRQIATNNATKIDTVSQEHSSLKIKLEGNCDEWGTDEYNYALGLKRAKTAKDALVADGISEDKIIMVSFGESNPICNQRNVSCWKLNRRVDYRLLP